MVPRSDLAGVVTAMITHKGPARALTRPSPARQPALRHDKDFADPLGSPGKAYRPVGPPQPYDPASPGENTRRTSQATEGSAERLTQRGIDTDGSA